MTGMNRLLRLIAVAVVACLAIAACTSTEQDTNDPDDTDADVKVDLSENGSSVSLDVGQTLELSLTGSDISEYQWEITQADDSLLTQTDESFLNDAAGSGGQQIYVFKATAPGSTTVKAEYINQQDSSEPPPETFSVDVTIKS